MRTFLFYYFLRSAHRLQYCIDNHNIKSDAYLTKKKTDFTFSFYSPFFVSKRLTIDIDLDTVLQKNEIEKKNT